MDAGRGVSDSRIERFDMAEIQEDRAEMLDERLDAIMENVEDTINSRLASGKAYSSKDQMTGKSKSLKERVKAKTKVAKSKKAEDKTADDMGGEADTASKFAKRNPGELTQDGLENLKSSLEDMWEEAAAGEEGQDQILDLVNKFYGAAGGKETNTTVYLQDEALAFLEEALSEEMQGLEGEDKAKMEKMLADVSGARGKHQKGNEKIILASRNIQGKVTEFSEKELGSPQALRNSYVDIIKNPRTTTEMFSELTRKYSYEKLSTALEYYLHALGADLNAEGSSIEPGLLTTLFKTARNIQANLQVFRFFKGRAKLLQGLMNKNRVPTDSKLNFENMAKGFMQLISTRRSDKSLLGGILGKLLPDGLSQMKGLLGKTFIAEQFRDGLSEVDELRMFSPERNEISQAAQKRADLIEMIIAYLEELYDEYEEMLEELEEEVDEDQLDLGDDEEESGGGSDQEESDEDEQKEILAAIESEFSGGGGNQLDSIL